MFVDEHYEAAAAAASRRARSNARWGWFYVVFFAANTALGVTQLAGGTPAFSFAAAALMAVMWFVNRSTVKRYEQTAQTYTSLARNARG